MRNKQVDSVFKIDCFFINRKKIGGNSTRTHDFCVISLKLYQSSYPFQPYLSSEFYLELIQRCFLRFRRNFHPITIILRLGEQCELIVGIEPRKDGLDGRKEHLFVYRKTNLQRVFTAITSSMVSVHGCFFFTCGREIWKDSLLSLDNKYSSFIAGIQTRAL